MTSYWEMSRFGSVGHLGRVTTGAQGYTVGASIAFGYVPAALAVARTPSRGVGVRSLGRRRSRRRSPMGPHQRPNQNLSSNPQKPGTNRNPETADPKTANPKTANPKPQTANPKPQTQKPQTQKPQTQKPKNDALSRTGATNSALMLWINRDERRLLHPASQGTGLGGALLELAERRGARGFRQIRLYTNETMTENVTWYVRHGFQEIRAESRSPD